MINFNIETKQNMKNIYCIIILALFTLMFGCNDVNYLHQEYLNKGEHVYLGKPDSIKAYGGYEKIRLLWQNNSDPKIKRARISWKMQDGTAQSKIENFDRGTNFGFVKDSIDISIPEGTYLFNITNLGADNDNLESIANEITGWSYGKSFQESLTARKVKTISIVSFDPLTLHFQLTDPDKTLTTNGSFITYVSHKNGVAKSVTVDLSDSVSEIDLSNLGSGDSLVIVSNFLPELKAISSFSANSKSYIPIFPILPAPSKLPEWKVDSYSYQFMDWGDRSAAKAFDGIVDAGREMWSNGFTSLPSWIILDFTRATTIDQVDIYRRYPDGNAKEGYIEVSNDKINWKNVGTFTFPYDGNGSMTDLLNKAVALGIQPAVTCQYLKLTATKSFSDPWFEIVEIAPHQAGK